MDYRLLNGCKKSNYEVQVFPITDQGAGEDQLSNQIREFLLSWFVFPSFVVCFGTFLQRFLLEFLFVYENDIIKIQNVSGIGNITLKQIDIENITHMQVRG